MNIPLSIIRKFEPHGIPILHDIGDDMMMALDRHARKIADSPEYIIMRPRTIADELERIANSNGATLITVTAHRSDSIQRNIYIVRAMLRGKPTRTVVSLPHPSTFYDDSKAHY